MHSAEVDAALAPTNDDPVECLGPGTVIRTLTSVWTAT